MKCLKAGTGASLLQSDHHLLVKTYKHIISDLEVLGLANVLHVSNSLNEVKLQTVDQAGRNHILSLNVGVNYPSLPPVIQADLPEQLIRNMKRVSGCPCLLTDLRVT
jgi:hypothetical protein